MHNITYEEFKNAVDTLELLTLMSKKDVRDKYLKLSKIYHPDRVNGSVEKFQNIQNAYEIITKYMDNFRFTFDENEFKRQNPMLVSDISPEYWIKN